MINEELDFTDAQILRIKAEQKLSSKQKKAAKAEMEMDTKKLLHELQVHQIELEMQNEELRLANETTEAALRKYTMLYDFAPMGYFTLDADGSIEELNFTGAEMLCERRFSLEKSNFKLFILESSLPAFNEFFSRLYATETKQSCDIMLGYDKKILSHVYIEGIVTGDDHKCLLAVVDILNFKKETSL